MKNSLQQQAKHELILRELEHRHDPQRNSIISFIEFFFREEKKKQFKVNWHHREIERKLLQVLDGTCTRLMILMPPGHGKTELITKCFPVWAMGKNPQLKICATGYSTALTQSFSGEARDYYISNSYKAVFPRRSQLRDDQNTKEFWENTEGGSYYATGSQGSITGRRFNIFINDDPLKPDEADSEVKRIGVNNWYANTVLSRLFDPLKDAVIIIMQRVHQNDLCGSLIQKMQDGTGEKWDILEFPAIAVKDDDFRKIGDALDPERFPLLSLETLRKSLGNVNFSCQYQQNPIAKESQEFHEEWFKYYDQMPSHGRIFTSVDPAFSKKNLADSTSIITGKFIDDVLYILEVTKGKFNPSELEDKIIYHCRKWLPEKIGVECVAAQTMIGFSLRNRLRKEGVLVAVEDIRQTGDKLTKIRRLLPLYRNGQIYHKVGVCDDLERELVQFPRGTHDDCADALQMLYNMYELQPNTNTQPTKINFSYDSYGRPQIAQSNSSFF